MAIGDWYNLNGYQFQETLHGPFVEHKCVDCGGFCVAVPDCTDARCELCFQRHVGVPPAHIRITGQIRPVKWLNPVGQGGLPAPEYNWEAE